MNKFLKPGVFILSLIPFLVIISKIYFNQLGPEPVKEIQIFSFVIFFKGDIDSVKIMNNSVHSPVR